ncbi:hypothetical protein LP422_22850 [Janibacter limosus]|nr:hypothetical protein LP422_22850 [Janibacter limosus]
MRRGPVVEQDRGAAAGGLLVPAHHHLAGPCRRAPVDATQVVADPVLTHPDVLLAPEGDPR